MSFEKLVVQTDLITNEDVFYTLVINCLLFLKNRFKKRYYLALKNADNRAYANATENAYNPIKAVWSIVNNRKMDIIHNNTNIIIIMSSTHNIQTAREEKRKYTRLKRMWNTNWLNLVTVIISST